MQSLVFRQFFRSAFLICFCIPLVFAATLDAQTVTTTNLSVARRNLAAASVGTKVLFAGGDLGSSVTAVIDIYDASSGSWQTPASLSQARHSLAAATNGNLVFFAGGENAAGVSSSVVDIYDATTGNMTQKSLSAPRTKLVAISLDNKVYFAGGESNATASGVIDVYNMATNNWDPPLTMPHARTKLAAGGVNGKLVFAGGTGTVLVDIYDVNTQQWNTGVPQSLTNGAELSAVPWGGRIFFAGGIDAGITTTSIGIYKSSSGTITLSNLSEARYALASAALNQFVYFGGGRYSAGAGGKRNTVEVFTIDPANNFTTLYLSQARSNLAAAVANDRIFFAGGETVSGVSSVVDIIRCAPEAFTVTGTNSYCNSAVFSVGLSGSEIGNNYQLFRNGVAVGASVPGTGGSLTFNNQSISATYTVVAASPLGCTRQMNGSAVITFTPKPVVTATPISASVCSGVASAIALASTVNGTTYTWTTSYAASSFYNAPFITLNNDTIRTSPVQVNGTSPGILEYHIYSDANGCPGMPVNVTIQVNPRPTATASPGAQTLCSGNPITPIQLTSPVGGTIFSVTPTTPLPSGVTMSGFSADSVINAALQNTGTAPATAAFNIVPSANGCAGPAIAATVNVNPIPQVTTGYISSVCSGTADSIKLLSNITNVATAFTWTASQSGNVSGLAQTGGGGTAINYNLSVSGDSAGTATYLIFSTANGCAGTPVTATVLVNPKPTVSAIPDTSSICTGGLTAIALSGTGTAYHWTATAPDLISGSGNGFGTAISQQLNSADSNARSVRYIITPVSNGCMGKPDTAYVEVKPNNTIRRDLPFRDTFCLNQPILPITFTTTGATNATFGTLPAGLFGSWANNKATIYGTPALPTAAGYQALITTLGGCGVATASAPIRIDSGLRVSLASTPGSNSLTVCVNTPIPEVRYQVSRAVSAQIVQKDTGLQVAIDLTNVPNDAVSWIRINGSADSAVARNYKVLVNGACGTSYTITGSVTGVAGMDAFLVSGTKTDSQEVCENTPILNISYALVGVDNAYVPEASLPAFSGLTVSVNTGVLTISGIPNFSSAVNGEIHYTVVANGSCPPYTKTRYGRIKRVSKKEIRLTSELGTDSQSVCKNTLIKPITYLTVGATGVSPVLPKGLHYVYENNVVTISGVDSIDGQSKYIVTATGGCPNFAADSGTVRVVPTSTIRPTSDDTVKVCVGSNIPVITYATEGATDATFDGLPPGVTGAYLANTVTISGTVKDTILKPFYNYVVRPVTKCGSDSAIGLIKINRPPVPARTNLVRGRDTFCRGSMNMVFESPFPDSVSSYTWSVEPANAVIKNDTVRNAAISFPASGTYVVTLIATSGDSCSSTVSQKVFVNTEAGIENRGIFLKQPGNVLVYPDNSLPSYHWGYDQRIARGHYDAGHYRDSQFYQFWSVTDTNMIGSLAVVDTPEYAFWVELKDGNCVSKVYYNGPNAKRRQAPEPPTDNTLRLQIVPNPNNGVFDLLLDGDLYGDVHAAIYNSLGQAVHHLYFTKKVESSKLQVRLDDLPAGVYYMQVSSSDLKKINVRFVIQPQ